MIPKVITLLWMMLCLRVDVSLPAEPCLYQIKLPVFWAKELLERLCNAMIAKTSGIVLLRLSAPFKSTVMLARSSCESSRLCRRMTQTIQSTAFVCNVLTFRKCIHLQDCFDVRNHICIVMELLGMSVFDFLKGNNFVPFPPHHVQHFAKQLLESVACIPFLDLC